LPVLGDSSGTVHAGALVALSADLDSIGTSSAEMAVQILEQHASPAQMRVRPPSKTILSVNMNAVSVK
jgi:ABC-type uncharacterized transport system substrate-binding protein